jgi:hypothetical protein
MKNNSEHSQWCDLQSMQIFITKLFVLCTTQKIIKIQFVDLKIYYSDLQVYHFCVTQNTKYVNMIFCTIAW